MLLFWGGGQRQSKLCAVFPRREPARTLTLLPPFTFFEKRGFQKKNSGEILAVLRVFRARCANPFTPFHFFLKSVVSKKKNSGEILAVLRVSKKRTAENLINRKYYDRTGKRTNFKENEKS